MFIGYKTINPQNINASDFGVHYRFRYFLIISPPAVMVLLYDYLFLLGKKNSDNPRKGMHRTFLLFLERDQQVPSQKIKLDKLEDDMLCLDQTFHFYNYYMFEMN